MDLSMVWSNSNMHNATWNATHVCSIIDNKPRVGIWYESNPFINTVHILMLQLILMNLFGKVMYYALRPLKQSMFVTNVLAGIIMGFVGRKQIIGGSTLFPVEGEVLMKTLGFLGMIIFIFLMGVKMDITMVQRTAKKATIIGIASLALPFASVLLWTFLFPKTVGETKPIFRGFYSSGLSVTRFTNVAYALDELNLLSSKLGQLVMSSTMMHEIFTWTSLVGGIYFRSINGNGSRNVPIYVVLQIFAVLVVTFGIIRPLMLCINRRTPKGKPVKEIFILGILVLALVMASITELIGSTHLGVLVLGLAIPDGPPLASQLVETTELFIMDFLMPLFYIVVGYNVTFCTQLFGKDITEIVGSVVLAFVMKYIGAVIGALCSKLSYQHAVLVGLMMNIKGPMDLYLFYRWSGRKEVTSAGYTILLLSHTLLTAIVTSLIDKLYNSYIRMDASINTAKVRAIQTNPINGELRILCCVHEEEDIPAFLYLFDALEANYDNPLCAYVAHLNNLSGRAAPIVSQDNRRIRRVQSNRSDRIAYEFEKYAMDSNGLVSTKMYTMITPYKSMHENICNLAEEELIPLVIVPFHKNCKTIDISAAAGIRTFNSNMQASAQCTVAILVDKGMTPNVSMSSYSCYSCNMAVIFIGGTDDREALAFGTRFLGSTVVNFTLLRLKLASSYGGSGNHNNHVINIEEMIEKKLDEAVIQEFKEKKGENPHVQYHEFEVKDVDQALKAMRTLGSHQDLIIVGRHRHISQLMFNDLMQDWTENPDLGIIGDFVTSSDFQGGTSYVLIMQQYKTKGHQNSYSFRENQEEHLLRRLQID